MNILIIEDDKLTLNLLQYGIQNLGHKVVVAESGEEGINQVMNGDFDLLISDIMMQGISGLSVVNTLRSARCKMPIIMMSALKDKSLLDGAFEAGANDFITKPFSIEELADMLKIYDNTISKKK